MTTTAQRLFDARAQAVLARDAAEQHGVEGAKAPATALLAEIDRLLFREPRDDVRNAAYASPVFTPSDRIDRDLLAPLRALPYDLLTHKMLDHLDRLDDACRAHIARERCHLIEHTFAEMRRRVFEHLTKEPR